ncbi:LamG-like jellyroll fold domain-containing protein [Pseudofulvibacter geojedonensis]|uniref:LamG-like jellyroll fold domain-containing protein n=1 Tax=Pseudofulvibacter geojedonensis TaxID=1123758 RepID=A0ABW3HXY1_9FLAO
MKNQLMVLTTVLLILFSSNIIAQNKRQYVPKPKYKSLFKTIPIVSEEDPEWVKLLYSDSPNYKEISAAFSKYYKTQLFKKNTHTQNFKYFSRIVKNQDYLLENGDVYIPTVAEENLRKERVLQSRNSSSSINSNAWVTIGPFTTFNSGGATQKSSQVNAYTFSQSISNPNVLFVGTETSGVYKSIDKGLHWSSVGDQVFNDGGVGVVEIDPTNENIVYVGAGSKLYKTLDGGTTWSTLLNISQLDTHAITINPNNPNIVLIAGNKGLRRSTDGGTTWTTIYTDWCGDIQLKTDNPNTVFLVKSNPVKNISEFFKSIDGGVTFSLKGNGWFSPIGGVALSDGGARIGVTNADANRVYVILLGNENDSVDDNNYIGIYRSDDAGESWSTPYDGDNDGNPDNEPGGPYSEDHWCFTHFGVTTTGYDQGFYDLAIGVSDTNPDHLMVGSLNLFKSEDGGKRYTRWGGYGCTGCSPGYRHPDIQDIEFNGADVWVCSDGGIDYYDGNLNFIESRNTGVNGSAYWGFDQGWNFDVLVGGRYHNGNAAYYQTYGTGNFLSLGGGESATGYVNKGENRKVFHSDISGNEIPDVITGAITNIPGYSLYPNEHYVYSRRSEVTNDPRYWNILYLGKDNKLWKSTNSGKSFSVVKTFGSTDTDFVKAIEVSRKDPNIIFVTQNVGNSGKLWKSIDGGTNWTDVTIPANHQTMYLSLNTENELFLALNNGYNNTNKVFKSIDLGATWTNLSTPALDGEWIENIQVQNGTDGGVYLTSNKTIWYRNNSHSDWQLFSNGLPIHFRITKILPFYRDGKIRIAGNRGIWERNLFEISEPKAQPMVATKNVHCSREEVQFEDFSILNHAGATWQWQFPGATTVSSTSVRNPSVTYANSGTYDVTLTITDGNGKTDTKTVTQMISVGENYCSPEPNPEQALQCSENNHYAINSTINLTNITNFSCTAWVKPNGIQPDYSAIFSLSSGNNGPNKNALNFREGNNTLGIHWNNGYWWWDSNLVVPENEWSYVAITVTPTTISLYVNEQKHTWNINSVPFDLNQIILGSYYGWQSRNFKGQLEEVTFWKKTLSDQEVKLSRHLTKSDVSNPDLIAYYQFNHNSNGKVYDKKGTSDLVLNGDTNLVASDAPVGPGTSQLLNVTSGGIKDFSLANLSMTFPSSGNYPNGDIVVSKINILPSNLPATNVIDNTYWIVNNYGLNTNFTPLESISFSQIDNIDTINSNNIFMYKRASNAGLTTNWNTEAIGADSVNTNTAIFTNTATIDSFSQFFIGSDQALSISQEPKQYFSVYPNPVKNGEDIYFKGLKTKARFILFDGTGKEVIKTIIASTSKIPISNLSNGIYFYTVETNHNIYTGKILID